MCSAETPIKTDRVKEDKKVSLEEKLELLEDIMDYDDALKPEMVLADLEEWILCQPWHWQQKSANCTEQTLQVIKSFSFETVQDICRLLKVI